MYRRVVVPILLVFGVWLLASGLSLAASGLERRAMDAALRHQATPLTLPVLPSFAWLLFLAIFLALRLCAARGGTRRECLTVGLCPLLFLAVLPLGLAVYQAGLRAVPIGLGLWGPYYLDAELTLGTIVSVRTSLSSALTWTGVCLAATWLYLYASGSGRLPAPHPDRVAV